MLRLLLDAAQHAPEQVIVHVRGSGEERVVSYRQLRDEALQVAGGYLAAGLRPGDAVPVVADRSDDFLPLFWGAVAAGLVPVPLAADPRRITPVWELLGRPPVAVDESTVPLLAALPEPPAVLPLARLRAGTAPAPLPAPAPVAFLQFSSGSTGAPKGVELTHANVLANVEQIRQAAEVTDADVLMSWMPYFHDMGLIGTHLMPLAARIKQVKLGPMSFAKRPASWFEVAARHRATMLSAANFALALVVRRVPARTLAALDLSSVRYVGVGAEPISAVTWRAFLAATAGAGLDPRALQPVYGLAEATLGVTCPPPGETAVPLRLDRAALADGRAVEAGDADAVELMDVGPPVPGCALRIVDERGTVLGEDRVGHVEVAGPNVAAGYHRAPQISAATFADGWLRTGDLGFLRGGRLCVTGRHKDVVFVNGGTFHAADLEQVAAATPGLPSETVAVVGCTDPVDGGERVVVLVRWARPPLPAALSVLDGVAARVRQALGHDDVRVLPLPPGAFARTTSGKLRRNVLRERFAAGDFDALAQQLTQARRAAAGPAGPVASPSAGPLAREEVQERVREIWGRVLGRPAAQIDAGERFLAAGGSSLKAMEVLAEIEDAFGITVAPAVLRDCDTVTALTDHVLAAGGARGANSTTAATEAAVAKSAVPGGDRAGTGRGDGVRQAGPTAVLGLACRFPGADTPEQFWDRLTAGHDAVTEVPEHRRHVAPGATARWGAFLDDPSAFDADYFGIDAEEARVTDPQARIFLELAHEALERAGYAGARRRARRIGVFAAVGSSGYSELLSRAADAGAPLPATALVGNLPNLVAARVAQALDLTGPAVAVDTACSSALVALHLARRAIDDGECDLAVVGGVNLNLGPTGHRLLEATSALSPTGRCHTFSAAADGFVPGEGGAALVLGRPADALHDGVEVLALLRGTATNNDGRSLSLMAPNPLRQREVVAEAYRLSGVDPDLVSYVEAHGTGTPIGDPTEVQSLAYAYPLPAGGRLRAVGSVKTNIGHLLNAAGMPALVKVVLALRHRQLPPSLHHDPPAPRLDLAGRGWEVVTDVRDWDAPGPLTAGVNAFGFGGTNAHAILQQAPPAPSAPAGGAAGPHLLTLSAHDAAALRDAAAALAAHLRQRPELDEAAVCASVATARDDGPYRLTLVADGDLAARLDDAPAGRHAGPRPRLVFVLPGQGSQSPGQGSALYASAPVFRRVLDEASAAVGPLYGRTLTQWCTEASAPAELLARTEITQPLVVAFGIALGRQLQAWGVAPDAVTGHSVGELAAACLAGTFTVAEAVRFAARRGRLMQTHARPGAMAAVRGGEETVADLVATCAGQLVVAGVNAADQVVVAGTPEAVDAAVAELEARGVAARRLAVSHAFHSPMMEPVLGPLAEAARQLAPGTATVPLLSTVTGEWNPQFDPAYLCAHAVAPVRFAAAAERLAGEGYDTFVELGAGPTLTGPLRAAGRSRPGTQLLAVAATRPGTDGPRALLETAGHLWSRGAGLDHLAVHAGAPKVEVPTYPFQRRSYWFTPAGPAPVAVASRLLHRLTWQEEPLAVPRQPASRPAPTAGPVLLLGHRAPLAGALADRLAAGGVEVRQRGVDTPEAVLLFAGPTGDLAEPDALHETVVEALAALRELIDGLGAARPRLLVVTEDLHVTGVGVEASQPGAAILAGLCRALADELPGLVVRTVDLLGSESGDVRIDALLRELAAPSAANVEDVAWRGGRRLRRTPQPVAAGETQPVPLPADGVYLITGGAGGVGAELARHLARHLTGPTLLLAGRSPAAPAGLLEELVALGAVARYVRADVTAADDVDTLVGGLERLDGVFHAAGVVRPGTLRGKTADEVTEVLAPKVRGARLLARALARRAAPPAFCLAFSSVSSVLPGYAGALGDYAAGNAFLDAFAAAQRAAGQPWQALNFAAFAQVGLAAAPGLRQAIAARGVPPLGTREALDALLVARGVDAAQLLVADLTPAEVVATSTSPVAIAAPVADTSMSGRSAGSASHADTAVRGLLGAVLHRDPAGIGEDEPFLGLGLDSLTAVDLVRQLERELGRQLPATLLFEYQTLGELVAYLQSTAPAGGPVAAADTAPRTAVVNAAPSGEQRVPSVATPLTPVQRAFHTNGLLHPDVPAYGYVRQTVTGALDPELLGHAFAYLARRHPMLRLRVQPGPDGPRQLPADPPPAGTIPPWYEVTELTGAVEELETALANRTFDLAVEAPVRAVLARAGADRWHLVVVAHHAAVDGFSLHLLGAELWTVYTALWQGRPPVLPPAELTFGEYAAALHADRTANRAMDLRYWRELLDGHEPSRTLPYDGDPDGPPAPPFATHQVTLDARHTAALRRRAAEAEVSLFHLLLAGYVRCLARWSGEPQVAVSVARAGRDLRLPGLDRLVGSCADTLPLLATAGPEPIEVLARRLRDSWYDAERHAHVSSLDLARLLTVAGSGPRTLAAAGFSFARFPAGQDDSCPVTVAAASAGTATAATRLGLLCWESGEQLHFSWNFPVRLFAPATVTRLAAEHRAELTGIVADAAGEPADHGGGNAADHGGGNAAEHGGGPADIVRRLVGQFRRSPDAVAVDTGTGGLTYAALDRASAELAGRLRAAGVVDGDLVGLLTEPGTATVTGVVGILRAGAGWVPLDAAHPPARLAEQVARCGVRVLVHDSGTAETAAGFAELTRVAVDGPPAAPRPFPVAPARPEAITYVIFTSGSTGRPKAVPITHRSMGNYLDWAISTFGYRAGDRLAQTAAVCFDASVRQLLAPLLVGATVVPLGRDLLRDPDALLDHLDRLGVTVWSSVPTLWERLLVAAEQRAHRGEPVPGLAGLRWVHVGGEALAAGPVRRWYDLLGPGRRLANLYGPTEATINATCHLLDERPDDSLRHVPIGRPVAGTVVEIVDSAGRSCRPGEVGELLIGGAGLTPGYLGDPELTAAAFVDRGGRRWYRSGDLVRADPDGVLEFVGRSDAQVKIRGHRVELGEIEAVLQEHPDVTRAAVLPTGKTGRLVAHVEARAGTEPVTLRRHLAARLPEYMLPGRWHLVDRLPLTVTGKVDRARLGAAQGAVPRPASSADNAQVPLAAAALAPPAPTGPAPAPPAATEAAPVTETERLLAGIWCELLELPVVGRDDDFFALGGDSIAVLEVFGRLAEHRTSLPRPTVIYTHRTLAALAGAVDTAAVEADVRPAAALPDTDAAGAMWTPQPYPLTPGQRGFLLAETLDAASSPSWLARLRLRGLLKSDRFQRAVDLLVVRHPMLRTVFPAGARPPVQQELPATLRLPVTFEVLGGPEEVAARIDAERRRRFEPWAWPLLRLHVLTVADDEHVLVVHAHHLIGDGYSAALLGRELLAAYDLVDDPQAAPLPALRSTFRDHVALLGAGTGTGASTSAGVDGQSEPATPVRQSPPYRPPALRESPWETALRPAHQAGFTLDAGQVRRLRALAADAGASLHAPVLTAYHRALAALTGQADLVIGLAVTGRDVPLPDVTRVFGPFAAAVPVRLGADARADQADRGFAADLREVVAEVAAARTHDIPARSGPQHGLPAGAQFFFTFLEFAALAATEATSLALSWDEADSELEPPPVGTDIFCAVRPVGGRLRITLRAAAAALDPQAFAEFTATLRAELVTAAGGESSARAEPSCSAQTAGTRLSPETGMRISTETAGTRGTLDAALIGYLPAPAQLAAYAGVPVAQLPRESIRELLFPGGDPRLVEQVHTPLGVSGFVCLPRFADELAGSATLAAETAAAVRHAGSLGARAVSLAGMIPAHTAYGFAVLRDPQLRDAAQVPVVTTGHAVTAVSVVRTVLAALAATGRELGELTVAVVGLGSIGRTSLELLLERAPRPPARLLLCDVAGSGPRLAELAGELAAVTTTELSWHESDPRLPAAVYAADLIIAAVSGSGALLQVERLRPGTVVVDDSFPHCFDTAAAQRRMRDRRDVLLVGGGLLDCGAGQRHLADGVPRLAAEVTTRMRPAGSLASCQLESLLVAATPGLAPVHGLVDPALARAHWAAARRAGVRAAPLHLAGFTVEEPLLAVLRAARGDRRAQDGTADPG